MRAAKNWKIPHSLSDTDIDVHFFKQLDDLHYQVINLPENGQRDTV